MKQFSLNALILTTALLAGAPVAAQELPEVGFSIIKTGKVPVVERLLLPDGRYTKQIDSNYVAILIKHKQDYVLFDTGLGSKIEEQYAQDMSYWQRPFFKFDKPVVPARKQLDDAGFAPIRQLILSHSHWDHAGGVQDFPEAKVMISKDEMETLAHPTTGAGGTWASQISAATIQWNPIAFQPVAYKGYAQSFDLFNDGRVVLVPMPGHTAGSIGMFVTADSGKCYFFIGDVAWQMEALRTGAPKFWVASLIVDHDRDQTMSSIEQVRSVMHTYPEVVVVPAHDSSVHNALGYFPNWIR